MRNLDLDDIKKRATNKTFFGNAGALGDKYYALNPKKDRLTVKSTVWGEENITAISVWRVAEDGTIMERISVDFIK